MEHVCWIAGISAISWFLFEIQANFWFLFTRLLSKTHWENLDNMSFLVRQFLVPSTLGEPAGHGASKGGLNGLMLMALS
jgi:hypothetical protein